MDANNYLDLMVEFVNDDNRNVMMLKGKWGVGKTFLWKELLENKKKELKYNCVSYVSLFGVADVQGIIDQTFYKAKYISHAGIRNLSRDAYRLAIKSGYANKAKELTKELEYTAIQDYLICIDDLERRNKSLKLESVLGTISYLVVENKCKVILIVNEDFLGEDKKELDTYREKVVDYDIEYHPTVRHNASIVFETDFLDKYLPVLEKVSLNNIRMLKLAKTGISYFDKFIHRLEPNLKNDIILHIILISFFYYIKDYGVDIKSLKALAHSGLLSKEGVSDEYRKAWQAGYSYAEYDKFIIAYLTKGFFDIEQFTEHVSALNQREQNSKIREKLWGILKLYNGNFQPNLEELEKELLQFIDDNIGHLNISELGDLLALMEGVGLKINRKEIVELYISGQIQSCNSIETLKHLTTLTADPKLLSNLNDKMSTLKGPYGIKTLVSKISEKQSWNRHDEEALDSFSEEDYYKWMLEENDQDLLPNLNAFIQFANPSSGHDRLSSIGTKMFKALDRIAEISKYNRFRIESLVNLDRYRLKQDI